MGCIGSRVALFRSCSFTSGSHSGSLTSSSGGVGSLGAVGGNSADAASRRASRRQNIFSVHNVDDTGQGVSPGKLEVTETDLVLHVKGKLPLTWPLRSLRRYGFDNDLFSFESGRRCPTGAGIFAFRCHRAQSLFNLLQSKIQGGAQSTGGAATSSSLPTLPSTPITPTNNAGAAVIPTVASAVTTPVSSTFVYVNLSESNSSRILSSGGPPPIPPPSSSSSSICGVGAGITSNSPSTVADVTPDVVQTLGASHVTPAVSSMASSSSRGPLCISSSKPSLESHPVYMNVDTTLGGALVAAASTLNYPSSLSNIPPPTAPRRVSTCSEKTYHHQVRTQSQVVALKPSSSYSSCSLLAAGTTKGKIPPDCALYSNVFCNHPNKGSLPPTADEIAGVSIAPLPIELEPAELNYAELDLNPDRPSTSFSTTSAFSSSSGRLGLFNKHHQLISTYSKQAEPFNTSRLNIVHDNMLEEETTTVSPGPSGEQNNGELGYATIDFDKTAQLNVTTRSKIALGFDNDEPKKGSSLSKKLRYGSTGL